MTLWLGVSDIHAGPKMGRFSLWVISPDTPFACGNCLTL
jgi:hypothetical protein